MFWVSSVLGYYGLKMCLLSVSPCRPDDVLWKRSLDENVLLHCILWPLVSLLLGTLIVLLTICARSLAVRAEAIQKRKFS